MTDDVITNEVTGEPILVDAIVQISWLHHDGKSRKVGERIQVSLNALEQGMADGSLAPAPASKKAK